VKWAYFGIFKDQSMIMRLLDLKINGGIAILLLSFILFSSCEEEEIQKLSFSETDVVDLVKLNFLAKYGGIERERLAVNALGKELTDACALEKEPFASTVSDNSAYSLEIDGNYTVQCKNPESSTFPWIFNFYNRKLLGDFSTEEVQFTFDGSSDFTIGYKETEQEYYYTGNTSRIIRNLRQNGEERPAIASLKIRSSGLCLFDFEEARLTPVNKYNFTCEITNVHSPRDKQNFAGAIFLENNRWTLTFDEGASYSLEN